MRKTLLLLLVLAAAACGPIRSFRDTLLRRSPYERYVASLDEAGLDRTALGARWIAAGAGALDAPRTIAIPHRGVERFRFVVRVQPELLAAGAITIAHARRAALLFPVPGAGRRNVQSLFGAGRSSGRREHQGIDIFAPRGTPVVAAANGWISSTSPNELGGNVVWLWDPVREHALYYAHLDRHAVSRGQHVRNGEVVGFVGNTGNARTTAPHLHFGIYRRGQGAIDPLYYVVDPPS